jgi:hypothetical protein
MTDVFSINNASYQTLFSTYMRAIGDLEVRSQTVADDNGADPLPKAFARSHVALGDQQQTHDTTVQDIKRNGMTM